MDTNVFNHEEENMHKALGFTDDQYDEVMFKVMQIMKRNAEGKQSETIAACITWAHDKFDTDELRAAAIFLMGQSVEKARMIQSVHEMGSGLMSSLRDKLKQSGDKEIVDFESEESMKGFMGEFKELIKEFNGEEASEFGENEGMIAIKLDPERRGEFHARLDALKKKYGVEGGEGSFPMSFGGPMAEA